VIIQGGRIVDPAQALDEVFDLRVSGGRIAEIGKHLERAQDEPIFDARNCYVAPGFIDMHVHLREPGAPEKETIQTGTAAALAGGFTAVACMPNTVPALDTPELIHEVRSVAASAGNARVYPVGALTIGRAGARSVDFAALLAAGAIAFSDDGSATRSARVLWDAAMKARDLPGRFISHCEDSDLKGDSVMTLGAVSRELEASGAPAVCEDLVAARDLLIAMECVKTWHLAHVSTANSVDLVRWAKSRSAPRLISCEVTPHHLLFSDELVAARGARAKVNPPLRDQSDVSALVAAVREGTIDAFASDHAPHTTAEKSGSLEEGAVGFSGLEIAVGAYALAVPSLSVSRYVALLSTNPAALLGIAGGTLATGNVADITIFADREWTVDVGRFRSKGTCTPFEGMKLPRKAVATLVDGRLTLCDDDRAENRR